MTMAFQKLGRVARIITICAVLVTAGSVMEWTSRDGVQAASAEQLPSAGSLDCSNQQTNTAETTDVPLDNLTGTTVADHRPRDAGQRGVLVRCNLLSAFTREQVAQGLAIVGWPDVVVKSGIALYRIAYTTLDAHGAVTVASGLLALPIDVQPIGVVAFGHG